ncbi:MAG: DsbE family thiol:disulfide interchange protein [Magnetococcales bacterium]|nr:DsbE family thiol:disulfide interchange protein [Magnetococcales bacterium]
MKDLWKWLLLLGVGAILGLFALGLGHDTRAIPSPLVGRAAPDFSAPALDAGPDLRLSDFKGRWVVVNFWGSWCVSCVAEHPYLIHLGRQLVGRSDVVIVGVDFKDSVEDARRFLARHGDPGYRHVFDPRQKVAIDWGVYGAPETYVVDPAGVVKLKHTGPLPVGWFESVLQPLLTAAR